MIHMIHVTVSWYESYDMIKKSFENGENLEGKGGPDVGSMPIPVPLESSESE